MAQGFEHRDRPWGIYVHRPEILAAAEVYRNWTSDLIMFVAPNIEVTPERASSIEALGVKLVRGEVRALEGPGGELTHVVMVGGSRFAREILLVWPHQTQCDLVRMLGLALDDDGFVSVDEGYHTQMPGLYAAGDLTYGGHQNTNTAIHMGNMAAASIVFDLCRAGAA